MLTDVFFYTQTSMTFSDLFQRHNQMYNHRIKRPNELGVQVGVQDYI